MTDGELIRRYRDGDVSAFETLLERYERPLLRYVGRYCMSRGKSTAQDVVQEVFLRLVRERNQLGKVRDVSSWLYRVAHNLAIDALRKESRMEQREQLVATTEEQPPSGVAERRELGEIVQSKLLSLPEKQRDVLVLKVQEGKSYREISDVTGLSTSNVGYLIHHGLKALARELRVAGVLDS